MTTASEASVSVKGSGTFWRSVSLQNKWKGDHIMYGFKYLYQSQDQNLQVYS